MRLAPWPCMLCPTNIFTYSPSSTPCDRRQRSTILFWNYFNLTSTEKVQSCKYIQIIADPFRSYQSLSCGWIYFSEIISSCWKLNHLQLLHLKSQVCKHIQKKKNQFSKLIPTLHSKTVCVNESRGGICREGKIPDLSQADTSYYQVHKIQPITKHHILLLGFAITT